MLACIDHTMIPNRQDYCLWFTHVFGMALNIGYGTKYWYNFGMALNIGITLVWH